jgi:primosomal replication protein N
VVKLVSEHLSPQQKAGLESVQVKNVVVSGNQATVSDADLTSAHGTLKGFINPKSPPTKLTKQSDGSWKLSG